MAVLISSVKRHYAAALTMLCLTLAVMLVVMPPARAHEIQPAVADIAFDGGRVMLTIDANLEAWIAKIGPEHSDTSQAPTSDEYDRLRGLEPAALLAELQAFAPQLTEAFSLDGSGDPIPLALDDASIGPIDDVALARISRIVLSGALPPRTGSVSLQTAPFIGELILRGTGDNIEYAEFLTPGAQSQEIAVTGATQRDAYDVIVQYVGVGFAHILPLGLDHILFVIGLFLLNAHMRPLLWQVSAFTLAHTVTLALGAADVVRVPGAIVEPLIALSIVYVCVENVLSNQLHRWRPVIIFAFGLLHGLGFASVFEEYGIPDGQFVPALLAFNIGVELGQLTVIAGCFLAVGLWFRDRAWYRSAITVPASVLIAAIGVYWSITRVGLVPEFLPYI